MLTYSSLLILIVGYKHYMEQKRKLNIADEVGSTGGHKECIQNIGRETSSVGRIIGSLVGNLRGYRILGTAEDRSCPAALVLTLLKLRVSHV